MRHLKLLLIIFFILIFSKSIYAKKIDKDDLIGQAEKKVALMLKIYGNKHSKYADSLENLAFTYCMNKKYDKALINLEGALEIKRKIFGDDHFFVTHVKNEIGQIYFIRNDNERAKKLYEELIRVTNKSFGKEYIDNVIFMANLGNAYINLEQYEKAHNVCSDALDISERLFITNKASSLGKAQVYKCLGISSYYLNDTKNALNYFDKIKAIHKSLSKTKAHLFGEKIKGYKADWHQKTDYIDIDFYKGLIDQKNKNYTDALVKLEKALVDYKENIGIPNNKILLCLQEIGETLQLMHQYDESILFFENAFGVAKILYNNDIEKLFQYYSKIAESWISLKEYERAYAIYRKSHQLIMEKGIQNQQTQKLLYRLAAQYEKISNYDFAAIIYKNIIDEKTRQNGYKKNIELIDDMEKLADCYLKRARFKKLIKVNKDMLDIEFENADEEYDNEKVISCLTNVAYSCKMGGKPKEALEYYEKALKAIKKVKGKESISYGVCLNNIGTTYTSLKKYKKALEYFQDAEKILIDKAGRQNSTTQIVTDNINKTKIKIKKKSSWWW